MNNIEKPLDEAILNGIDELKGMTASSDEYKATVDSVTKLADRAIEIKKLEAETAIQQKTAKDDKVDKIVKNVLTGASIVIGAGVTIWGSLKSWKFEEEGTVSSTAGRAFISRLFKSKN